MKDALIARMAAAQDALLSALDGRDLGAIEAAGACLAAAVTEARQIGGWRGRSDLRDAVLAALAGADTVRARLNVLADRNRRDLDRLAQLAGEPRKISYTRAGTLA